jgi:hypothetical protein
MTCGHRQSTYAFISGKFRSTRIDPKEPRTRRRHGLYKQRPIEVQVSGLAARLGYQKAPVTGRPV